MTITVRQWADGTRHTQGNEVRAIEVLSYTIGGTPIVRIDFTDRELHSLTTQQRVEVRNEADQLIEVAE